MTHETRIVIRKLVSDDEVFDTIRQKFPGARVESDGSGLRIEKMRLRKYGTAYVRPRLSVRIERKADKLILVGESRFTRTRFFWVVLIWTLGLGLLFQPFQYRAGLSAFIAHIDAKLAEAGRELE